MLFNPFRSGEGASRSPAGLGLGLYISNEVIRRHGGEIEVRSTAGEGTTFRVLLPREAIATRRPGVTRRRLRESSPPEVIDGRTGDRGAVASYRLITLHAKVTIHKPHAAHAITP